LTNDKLAVSFCGTILTVTRTGRYPASLVFREPGLSSEEDSTSSATAFAYSLLSLVYVIRSSVCIWKYQSDSHELSPHNVRAAFSAGV